MPQNKYKRSSPIESFRNHIPCGKLSCKTSCDHNSLQCIVCQKFFHYKCKGLSQNSYQNIVSKDLGYICSKDCLSATLPFFVVNDIEFLDTITRLLLSSDLKTNGNAIIFHFLQSSCVQIYLE